MKLRLLSWMRSLDDASLKRVADAAKWARFASRQSGAYNGGSQGCLLCHASGNKYDAVGGIGTRPDMPDNWPPVLAERRYMRYAALHGNERSGRVMNQLARGILARRALAEMPQEPRTLEAVS
jgi:hypothetical protein